MASPDPPIPTFASPSVQRITFEPIAPLLAIYTAEINPGPSAVNPDVFKPPTIFFKAVYDFGKGSQKSVILDDSLTILLKS